MSGEVVITGTGAVTAAGDAPTLSAAVGLDAALAALPATARTRATRAERVTQLALGAACRAFADAGLAVAEGEPARDVGIVLGTAFGCFLTNAAFQERLAAEGVPGASPRLFAATVSNAAAGELAIACRLGGPLLTVSAGAASGLLALHEATALVERGDATAVVAGGMDAAGAPLDRWLGELRWPACSEAAAMLVCEDGQHASTRGARVHGAILASASGFEPRPRDAAAGQGLRAAVASALAGAGATPADVALVVSGATPALAGLEAGALAAVAGRRLAPKRVVGEVFAAAGPLGVVLALAEAPRDALALIVDVCESGHVAALVVRSTRA